MVSETCTEVKRQSRTLANGDSAMDFHGCTAVSNGKEAALRLEASNDLPYELVTAIDPKDKGTPDDWIPRHPDLIRLTGRSVLRQGHPKGQQQACGRVLQTPLLAHVVGLLVWTALCAVRRHPLNVEPPPSALMDRGFITPSSLHYVRNHGAVPRLTWKDHRLVVKGLVDRQRTFTMDEIAAMPQVPLPPSFFEGGCQGGRSAVW